MELHPFMPNPPIENLHHHFIAWEGSQILQPTNNETLKSTHFQDGQGAP